MTKEQIDQLIDMNCDKLACPSAPFLVRSASFL